jgi:hypothetical protein
MIMNLALSISTPSAREKGDTTIEIHDRFVIKFSWSEYHCSFGFENRD